MLKQYPDKAKLIIKHFPLNSHRFAKDAAFAALASNQQGKYQEYSRLLFQNYRRINKNSLTTYALKTGLNVEQLEQDMTNPQFPERIMRDTKMGRMANVRGVPAIFIGGKKVKNWSIPNLTQAIKQEIEKQ